MLSGYWLRRLFWAVPTLFGVALIVFVLLRIVPGDPIAMLIPPGARAEDIANLREFYGLDKPIWQQFVVWLGEVWFAAERRSKARILCGTDPISCRRCVFTTLAQKSLERRS